jgi:hypothetical protein
LAESDLGLGSAGHHSRTSRASHTPARTPPSPTVSRRISSGPTSAPPVHHQREWQNHDQQYLEQCSHDITGAIGADVTNAGCPWACTGCCGPSWQSTPTVLHRNSIRTSAPSHGLTRAAPSSSGRDTCPWRRRRVARRRRRGVSTCSGAPADGDRMARVRRRRCRGQRPTARWSS